jgi:hypothetical protein
MTPSGNFLYIFLYLASCLLQAYGMHGAIYYTYHHESKYSFTLSNTTEKQQFTYNVTLRHLRETIDAVATQTIRFVCKCHCQH